MSTANRRSTLSDATFSGRALPGAPVFVGRRMRYISPEMGSPW